MPRYDYECPKCETVEERICAIAERNSQMCACGTLLRKLMSASNVETWTPAFWDLNGPSDSVFITSKQQLRRECEKRGKYSKAPNDPVVRVGWNQAAAFCRWLSKNEGKRYRLPTEAE